MVFEFKGFIAARLSHRIMKYCLTCSIDRLIWTHLSILCRWFYSHDMNQHTFMAGKILAYSRCIIMTNLTSTSNNKSRLPLFFRGQRILCIKILSSFVDPIITLFIYLGRCTLSRAGKEGLKKYLLSHVLHLLSSDFRLCVESNTLFLFFYVVQLY